MDVMCEILMNFNSYAEDGNTMSVTQSLKLTYESSDAGTNDTVSQ